MAELLQKFYIIHNIPLHFSNAESLSICIDLSQFYNKNWQTQGFIADTWKYSAGIIRLTWWTRHSTVERVLFEEELSFDRKAQERKPTQSRQTGELPRWRRIVNLLCGYEPPKENIISEEEKKEALRALTSIKEERKWKYFVNINALILLTIGMFLWGFYS
ncbi:hypothetical protein CHS0354_013336 [Potamilus streckersoni]|uniref:Uncharacterized protein n=1 Tax=Potamilus streckersoni TaxID=2493646 RepID=A0AAE0T2T7_9BIVA|nr:hypothetical protein CHS0354_013336 [Potamilus streckersoni]